MGFRSLINYLVGVPHFEHAKLLSIFNGEKIDVDPSVRFDKLKKELIAGKYSRRTVKLYLEYKRELLKFLEKAPYQISNDDAKNYRYYLAEKKNASASTLNTEINALKFCYG